ncbi:MAG: hypothetical protein ACREQ5_29880 [Candidatus Dormibacteria bacterium]
MEANVGHDPLPPSLHDAAAVLIVRHLENHRPEVVVRCLFDSYERTRGEQTIPEQRIRDAERLAERRLRDLRHATPQAWSASQSRVAL